MRNFFTKSGFSVSLIISVRPNYQMNSNMKARKILNDIHTLSSKMIVIKKCKQQYSISVCHESIHFGYPAQVNNSVKK